MIDKIIKLSPLNKTWIFDIDGTIVKHNGYKIDGEDTLLEGAREFFETISPDDRIILVTSRKEEYKELTESFLKEAGIRFDSVIYGLPYGERILVNDRKPSGLAVSIAVNTIRDEFMGIRFVEDKSL